MDSGDTFFVNTQGYDQDRPADAGLHHHAGAPPQCVQLYPLPRRDTAVPGSGLMERPGSSQHRPPGNGLMAGLPPPIFTISGGSTSSFGGYASVTINPLVYTSRFVLRKHRGWEHVLRDGGRCPHHKWKVDPPQEPELPYYRQEQKWTGHKDMWVPKTAKKQFRHDLHCPMGEAFTGTPW
jgi:hypothetical protein